jgi:ribonuclease III
LATEILLDPARQNYKEALQSWTQRNYKSVPEYRVRESGETTDFTQRFIAEAWFRDLHLGTGSGHSKKAAEQAAAKIGFAQLTVLFPNDSKPS